MFHKYKQYICSRRFGVRTITSVALSSLFAGLLVASSVQWTPMSMAQGLDQQAVRMAGTPTAPNSFAELAERLGPTVVNIQVTKVAPVGDSQGMPGLARPSGEFFRHFFQDRLPQRAPHRMQGKGEDALRRHSRASSSAVIISPDGYILTYNHVVDGAQEIRVTLHNGQWTRIGTNTSWTNRIVRGFSENRAGERRALNRGGPGRSARRLPRPLPLGQDHEHPDQIDARAEGTEHDQPSGDEPQEVDLVHVHDHQEHLRAEHRRGD